MDKIKHITSKQLEAELHNVLTSPKNNGDLKHIFVRRYENNRESPKAVFVSSEKGVEGDRWCLSKQSDPNYQVTVMNSRFLKFIAQEDERISLAGDNLIVDLDLSQENLPAGQRLEIGHVLAEVTHQPHKGCRKFADRFGKQVLKFINSPDRRSLNLRGVYLRILCSGLIHVGDTIKKV